MNNVIDALKEKNIIDDTNPIKNKALETLLNFDMPCDFKSIFNNSLFFDSSEDIQLLVEVQDKDIKFVDIIKNNFKYSIISNSDEEKLGVKCVSCEKSPFFTTHFCSLKNNDLNDSYDYMDIICGNKNIFDFNEKTKSNIKVLGK